MHFPAKKYLGQHFLCDNLVCEQIITAIAPQITDHIVEIGPGTGALTIKLLPKVAVLDAIELDQELIDPLKNRCLTFQEKLIVHHADAMKFKLQQLIKDDEKLRIVGNLPYNIATQLIFRMLAQKSLITDMHFMLQKEVAERIVAAPQNKHYGKLSIMVQYHCYSEILFYVAASSFRPQPKVASAVIRIIPHRKIPFPVKNIHNLEQVVQQAFMQRRKIIQNGLKQLISAQELQNLGLTPTLRPEQLTVQDFVTISNYLVDKN